VCQKGADMHLSAEQGNILQQEVLQETSPAASMTEKAAILSGLACSCMLYFAYT
jgi:hypothetical protein